ncbi:hypothetical protein [Tissierella sp.]|uniref:hypothetical protein n=1 Tax=Tissierella sp. TaxID=41274 RepID=UPI0028AD4D18|nr:hypothetical protein [Tissierella sp.]
MNRKLFALIILIPSISSYGVSIENVGTYYEDGSYQLRDEELIRYNNLTSEMKEGLNHIKFGNSFHN